MIAQHLQGDRCGGLACPFHQGWLDSGMAEFEVAQFSDAQQRKIHAELYRGSAARLDAQRHNQG
jgi:hypothetical protein